MLRGSHHSPRPHTPPCRRSQWGPLVARASCGILTGRSVTSESGRKEGPEAAGEMWGVSWRGKMTLIGEGVHVEAICRAGATRLNLVSSCSACVPPLEGASCEGWRSVVGGQCSQAALSEIEVPEGHVGDIPSGVPVHVLAGLPQVAVGVPLPPWPDAPLPCCASSRAFPRPHSMMQVQAPLLSQLITRRGSFPSSPISKRGLIITA